MGVALACASSDDGSETGTASTSGSSATSNATTTTSGASTSADDTSGGPTTTTADSSGSGDTGGLPRCEEVPDEAACVAIPACVWMPVPDYNCWIDCSKLDDADTCAQGLGCVWVDDACIGPV